MAKEKKELSVGRITVKFIFKLILWALLIIIVGGIISIASKASVIEDSNDDMEIMEAGISMIHGLIITAVLAGGCGTFLATRGIKKRAIINQENVGKICKRITIVLVVFAIIVIIARIIMINVLDNYIMENAEVPSGIDSLGELIKEAEDKEEEILDDWSGIDDIDDAIDALKGFNNAGKMFIVAGAIYLVMIPVSTIILKKDTKEE